MCTVRVRRQMGAYMTDTMRSAMFESAGHMAIEDVAKPTIEQPDDAVVRVVRTCVCGSDLWSFRGINQSDDHSTNPGHEAIGIVGKWARPSPRSSPATS